MTLNQYLKVESAHRSECRDEPETRTSNTVIRNQEVPRYSQQDTIGKRESAMPMRTLSQRDIHEPTTGIRPRTSEVPQKDLGDNIEVIERVVEIPQVEWREKIIYKPEVRERERFVKRVDYKEVIKEVEVPETHWVTREVEIEVPRDVIREVVKREIREVPIEIIKYQPRVEVIKEQREVEVPGSIVEVPKRVLIENRTSLYNYKDTLQPTVVRQTVQPVLRQVATHFPVFAFDYDPVLVKVVVPVPKPVKFSLLGQNKPSTAHKYVSVTHAHYNGLLCKANPGINYSHLNDLLVSGIQPSLERVAIVKPNTSEIHGEPKRVIPNKPSSLLTPDDVYLIEHHNYFGHR